MVSRLQIKRTTTNNSPPADHSLLPGELAIEMGVPTRVWIGVPNSISPTGKKLLLSSTALVSSVNGHTGTVTLGAHDVGALPITGGDLKGPLSVNGQPVVFTGHKHVAADITDLAAILATKQPVGNYAALIHQHTIAQVLNLQAELDAKQARGSYAAELHTHSVSQIASLQMLLDGKAPLSHRHNMTDINGLQQALAAANGRVVVSSTEPATPSDGLQWWDPTANKMQIFYGGQWFEVIASGVQDGAVTTTKIGDRAVTNAKMANMPFQTFKGRVSPGSGPPEDVTVSQARALLGGIPSGAIMDFAGQNAPEGWLICAGQVVSRVTYKALFDVIGTIYGGGDGSTTFNLPDFRGRVGVGKDDMNAAAAGRVTAAGSGIDGTTVGAVGGAESVAITAAQLPPHEHMVASTGAATAVLYNTNALVRQASLGGNSSYDLRGINSKGADIGKSSTVGSGAGHPNMPPSIIVTKIIKT